MRVIPTLLARLLVMNDFLMWQMEHIDGNEYNNEIYRSPKPPYGKRYCNGHPSPNSIKKLCERIYKELNK